MLFARKNTVYFCFVVRQSRGLHKKVILNIGFLLIFKDNATPVLISMFLL